MLHLCFHSCQLPHRLVVHYLKVKEYYMKSGAHRSNLGEIQICSLREVSHSYQLLIVILIQMLGSDFSNFCYGLFMFMFMFMFMFPVFLLCLVPATDKMAARKHIRPLYGRRMIIQSAGSFVEGFMRAESQHSQTHTRACTRTHTHTHSLEASISHQS